ncbi:hypothetical protein AXFE_36830 [Acidithrix ferrooxidans]|uniref:Uncharacterized protein n=1 Tax=Acidithrix ferrooxidans TaxID=1280514 RepID=A0A0D8HC61_9ACTN|nr:hypothetical protein AXFE_36830 [Acidithrix ferrooxidans]
MISPDLPEWKDDADLLASLTGLSEIDTRLCEASAPVDTL